MKLSDIYEVVRSGAFGNLAKQRVNPGMAYGLMRYGKELMEDFKLIEEKRVQLVKELSKDDSDKASLKAGSPEFAEYIKQFGTFLGTESEVDVFGMEMNEIVKELESKENNREGQTKNTMTCEELALLEPFFKLKELKKKE